MRLRRPPILAAYEDESKLIAVLLRPTRVCVLCVVLAAGPAWGRPVRRVFQPQDMDLQGSGLAELTLQFGPVRGQTAYRVSSPAFELDLGLTEHLELDVSGEFAVGGPNDGSFTLDRTSPDNTWVSLKAGLLDVSAGDDDAFTLGVQVGPEIPTARSNRGVGISGLFLLGWRHRDTIAVVNAGGLLDPDPGTGQPCPAGLGGGLDVTVPVDAAERWALYAGMSAVRYLTTYPYQMNFLGGVIWSPSDRLDVSLTALVGPKDGGDRWGVLLGFTPKAKLW